jgi:hypothetical protein
MINRLEPNLSVAVFAWQSTHGQVAPEPISTSSVSIKKKEELPAQPAPSKADEGRIQDHLGLKPRSNAQLQKQLRQRLQWLPICCRRFR